MKTRPPLGRAYTNTKTSASCCVEYSYSYHYCYIWACQRLRREPFLIHAHTVPDLTCRPLTSALAQMLGPQHTTSEVSFVRGDHSVCGSAATSASRHETKPHSTTPSSPSVSDSCFSTGRVAPSDGAEAAGARGGHGDPRADVPISLPRKACARRRTVIDGCGGVVCCGTACFRFWRGVENRIAKHRRLTTPVS